MSAEIVFKMVENERHTLNYKDDAKARADYDTYRSQIDVGNSFLYFGDDDKRSGINVSHIVSIFLEVQK